MSRLLRLLLLVAALLWAQFALTEHGIAHTLEGHDETCIECLALPGFAALPAAPVVLPAASAKYAAQARAVQPAPSFASPLPFRSRAPPDLLTR
jgi:hypothetical protein